MRGELDWIVMKALEKDRTRRYETANGFAADVLRYLTGEAVQAHPPSVVYRLKKFVRRNRGVVTAANLVVLALLAGIGGTTWGLIRAENRLRDAEEARAAEAQRVTERDEALGTRDAALGKATDALAKRDEAVRVANTRADELKYRLGVSNMVLAAAAYNNQDVKLAAERQESVPLEQRGWEWLFLKTQMCGLFTLSGHMVCVTSVAYSADGTRIATGSKDKTVRVWDATTGTLRTELKGHTDEVTSVSFSPDGTRIVSGSKDKTAKVWDARTGLPALELKGHTGSVETVSFSPDGARIVTQGVGTGR